MRRPLPSAAGKPIERRLSAPSSYGLRCKSPTMARRAAAGDRAPPWDAEGVVHFGRRVAQHSPALARTDPHSEGMTSVLWVRWVGNARRREVMGGLEE